MPKKPIPKPIAKIICFADFRFDRCPAKIAENDHITDISACLRCEYSEIKQFRRGKLVSEIGKKEMQEPKEWAGTPDVEGAGA